MEPTIIESAAPVVIDDPDLQVLIVGIPWKGDANSGFIIQLGYGKNDDGSGYCIDTQDQVTHYGGILEFEPMDSDWRFRLEPDVAADMGIPTAFTVRFDAAATNLSDAVALVQKMLSHPRGNSVDHDRSPDHGA